MEDAKSQPSCELLEWQVRNQLRTGALLVTEGHNAETIGVAEQGHRHPTEHELATAEPDRGVGRMVPWS